MASKRGRAVNEGAVEVKCAECGIRAEVPRTGALSRKGHEITIALDSRCNLGQGIQCPNLRKAIMAAQRSLRDV